MGNCQNLGDTSYKSRTQAPKIADKKRRVCLHLTIIRCEKRLQNKEQENYLLFSLFEVEPKTSVQWVKFAEYYEATSSLEACSRKWIDLMLNCIREQRSIQSGNDIGGVIFLGLNSPNSPHRKHGH